MATARTASILRAQAAPFEPRPPSPSPDTIANAFRQLTLADAAESRAANNKEHVLTLQVPEAIVTGDADSARVASGTVAGSEEETRPEEPPAPSGRHASASPVSPSDLGFCAQCHGPREYCHGHESPDPTPVPAPVNPVPVPAPSTSTGAMAHFRLTRQEAMSLADNIANALEVRRQDSPEVPPPYPEDRQVAEGMGVRRGRGQRGRPRQPVAVHYAVPPAHPRHAQRGAQASHRPLSPAAQGYENNQGTSYVPFTILDATGRQVPARYIKVHMTDNPYVEARMAMDGPVHRGEIHAAAATDRVGRTPDIGPDELRLIDRGYTDWMMVDEAIAHVGDRSLTAEVMRWRGLQKKMKAAQESIRQIEDRLFAMAVDQRACRARLEEAWAVHRIEEEMRRDRRVTALTAWSVERGRLP
jgi:hypothetical protein